MIKIQDKLIIRTISDSNHKTQQMNGHAKTRMITAMILSDIVALFTATFLAMLIRIALLGPVSVDIILWVFPFAGIFIVTVSARGLYPAIELGAIEEFRLLTITTSLLFLFIGALSYIFKAVGDYSRLVLALSMILCLISIPLFRFIVRHLMSRANLWGEPIAIIGYIGDAQKLAENYKKDPKIGLNPGVIFGLNKNNKEQGVSLSPAITSRIIKYCQYYRIRIAMVIYDDLEEIATIREALRDDFEKVICVYVKSKPVDLRGFTIRRYGRQMSFESRQTLLDLSTQRIKRAIDLLMSGFGLILLAPLFVVIALLIALDSPGKIFYRQKRLGKDGRQFEILKFRTMCENADLKLKIYLKKNPEMLSEWERYQKLKVDPRITRVGKILRRFSLDEFPQLWNVLVGEMSVVGPRPIMTNQKKAYGTSYNYYMRVYPGITGWWQISGRNKTSFNERASLDEEYVLNWSIWTDIYIIVRTVWVVLSQKGAI